MPKSGTADDNVFGQIAEKEKPKRGNQEDGTYITSDGTVLPAKNRTRREPYPEPPEKQKDGNEELVETPDGKTSFAAVRLSVPDFGRIAKHVERKRQKCNYQVTEVYAGQPRPFYSYDELEQLRKGELKR